MPSAAVRRLSPLQWAGVGLGGCAVLLALLGLLAPASAFFFPLLSLWASVGLFVLALCVLRVAGVELNFFHKAVVFGIWAVAVVYFYWTLSSRSFIYVWDYANYLLKQYDAEAAFAQSTGGGLRYLFGSMADDYTNFITLFTEFPFCLTDHTGDAYSFSQVFCILPTLLVLLAGLVVKVGQLLNVKNRMYYFLFGMTLTAAYPFLRMSAVLAQPDWFGLIFAFAILLLTLDFPAADAASYSVGQSVDVTIDGTFESTTGTIQSISGADSLSSGNLAVRSVVIAVPNPGTLNTAMSGTASINGVSAMGSAHFTCQYEQTITASASGTVAALCVKEGSSVGVDTALIQLSSSSLTKQVKSASNSLRSAELSLDDSQRSMEDYTITSPISGTIIEKDVKVGDTVGSSSSTTETMCVIYDLSYLEMTLNVDELDILDIAVGQKAEITADAIDDQTFEGVVTSISSAGTTTGGTTTYPVTIRIDDTGSLMPGMNATAVIDIASAEDALSIPSYAVVRGNYVLVTKDSPSAVNADTSMNAPDGYVYVKVTTGISDDDYIAVTSGLEEGDTIAYDSASASKSSSDEQMGFPGGGMSGGGGPGGGGRAPGGGF